MDVLATSMAVVSQCVHISNIIVLYTFHVYFINQYLKKAGENFNN